MKPSLEQQILDYLQSTGDSYFILLGIQDIDRWLLAFPESNSYDPYLPYVNDLIRNANPLERKLSPSKYIRCWKDENE